MEGSDSSEQGAAGWETPPTSVVGGGNDDVDSDYSDTSTDSCPSPEPLPGKSPNYPNPKVLDEMNPKDSSFDWKAMRELMKGPICWACFLRGPFFCCDQCGKEFHRKCAIMTDGYPHPEFDTSVEQAMKAESGTVTLLKCAPCMVSEKTQITQLMNVEKSLLNRVLYLIGSLVDSQYGGNLVAKFPTDGITASQILGKAKAGEYETVEGFFNDFRMILYDVVAKYALQSEASTVAGFVVKAISQEIARMVACMECTLRRFDCNGKLRTSREFAPVNQLLCKVPHVLLWVKEGPHSFWPAKVIHHDSVKHLLYVQCFGERATARSIPFPAKDAVFKTFSIEYPGDKVRDKDKSAWRAAFSDCKGYLDNLRKRFGEAGVIIPEKAEEFQGDLEAAVKKMFPRYGEEAENQGAKGDDDLDMSIDNMSL